MNDMTKVFIEDGLVKTDSLKIAREFNKNHGKVLRDIRELGCSEEFFESNFGMVEYVDKKSQKRPKYSMTYDGFIFIVMGYNGKKADVIKEKYIEEFNRYRDGMKDKSEQLDEIVIHAKVKEVTLEDINKIRFSEKRTIRTFENLTSEYEARGLVAEFTDYAYGLLDTSTRIARCSSAVKGLTRLHDRLANEGASKAMGDCYNLLLLIDKVKGLSAMTKNRQNGGIKSYQRRQLNKLTQTGS